MKLVYLILSAIKVFYNMVQSVILSLHMGNLYLFKKKKKKMETSEQFELRFLENFW